MKPTLEEVKKYFENAEKIKDHSGDVGFPEPNKFIFTELGSGIVQNVDKENWLVLWDGLEGFAKILTTKEPSFSITKEQLRQLTDPKVKEWFPEVFKVKLEVGKWYKSEIGLFCITKIKNNIAHAYGFQSGIWKDKGRFTLDVAKNDVEATEQEVFEVLKNEAVKRGFVEGARITPMFSNGKDYYPDENIINKPLNFKLKGNILVVDGGVDGYRIFVNGIWATIIPPITKSKAEKLLNRKIID